MTLNGENINPDKTLLGECIGDEDKIFVIHEYGSGNSNEVGASVLQLVNNLNYGRLCQNIYGFNQNFNGFELCIPSSANQIINLGTMKL